MNVLVAADGSAYSGKLVSMVNALQLPDAAAVTVMTVVPEYTLIGGVTLGMLKRSGMTPSHYRKKQEQKARALLDGLAAGLARPAGSVPTAVAWGKPSEQILQKAAEMGADLLVVGAKGVNFASRFTLGSTAQRVVRYARGSVLIVREGPRSIRHTFLATDGSPHSEEALRFLLDLPLSKKSQLTVLTALKSHSEGLTSLPALGLNADREILRELQKAEEKTARDIIEKTRKRLEGLGYDTSTWLLKGEPAEQILTAANEIHPDLIVLGAGGRAGVEPNPMGSVAYGVALQARYSVLIVRSGQPDN